MIVAFWLLIGFFVVAMAIILPIAYQTSKEYLELNL